MKFHFSRLGGSFESELLKSEQQSTAFFASKENGHFLADYLKENEVTTNISCYRIIGNLSNIFEENYYEENACNTVKKLELVFREKGIEHENGWKTAKEIATPKRHEDFSFQLDEVVCGFSNFCRRRL